MLRVCIIFLLVLFLTEESGSTHVHGCKTDYYYWEPWTHCSRSCGGGTRSRVKLSCHIHDKKSPQEESCNTNCFYGYTYGHDPSIGWMSLRRCLCSPWRGGKCCEYCRQMNIEDCRTSKIKCTGGSDPYFSPTNGYGCKECTVIDHCYHRNCTGYTDTKCLECVDNNVFFKLTPSKTRCERMCAWNNHLCWPGTCSDDLKKGCSCSSNFSIVSEAGETSCQPTQKPSVETCLTTFVGGNGKKKQSKSSTSSSACEYHQDVYGNVQVKSIEYDMLADFTIKLPYMKKPTFIKESNFGVTDVTAYLEKVLPSGENVNIGLHTLLRDVSSSTKANSTFSKKGAIFTDGAEYNLRNAEWLCVRYEALGGGYVKGVDTSKVNHIDKAPTPYRKTNTRKSICYRFDNNPPEHCKVINKCVGEPLFIKDKLTRSQTFSVHFQDWTDPVPDKADKSRASSIESYHISIHETLISKYSVKVDTGNIFNKTVDPTEPSMILTLPTDSPRLYAIVLDVKDVADNVRQARRFVLYDNTSFIERRPDHALYVASASPNTNYLWQTHHNDVCLIWRDHFFNKDYPDASPLNPIEPDPSGLITGVYDQIEGTLPVSGTTNIQGITNFRYFWSLNGGNLSDGFDVPNFLNQSHCKHFDLKDGQTYEFNIEATDVVNNTCESNVTIHIDRSAPHIKNIWLQKGSDHRLFVHDSKELAQMSLYFDTLDPHSGVLNVNWAFGTTDSASNLLTGVLSPELKGEACPSNIPTCYCPDIGKCEIYNYSIPLNKLVAANKNRGDHNRNYYFSIKATNNALLSNIEHIEVLVDDSPPEPGTINEGPPGSRDIDYTSDNSTMVNWHGFIDHESGIKLYRIGVAGRCLDQIDLKGTNLTDDIVDYVEVPYEIKDTKVNLNGTGKFFVTIVALNNAMDPSIAVCTDGIVRDVSPPRIENLTLLHGGWSETIGCLDGKPWLIDASMVKVPLQFTDNCLKRCSNTSGENGVLQAIPEKAANNHDSDLSNFLCQSLPNFNQDNIIYIPDDYILMEWANAEIESQLEDYFVGFGTDPSEVNAPGILGYTSTHGKAYFKRRHEGIGSNSIFYMLLKAVSKAGLSHILTIGPIIIDVSPPVHTKLPVVDILDDYIHVSWENDTFYDSEQATPIDQIMFQFATDDGPVTPIHEWRLELARDCTLCFRYPLARLQAQDNDIGQDFLVRLFVYNAAGHFLEVNTEKFRLPSKYPPGNALIYDQDPDLVTYDIYLEDVALHYTENVICAAWSGFKHHENVEIEIGVGLNETLDSVVQFHKTNSTNSECLHSKDITFDHKYHFLVRAKCSGGETISSSNGVTLLDVDQVIKSLQVKTGKSCQYEKPFYNRSIELSESTTAFIEWPLEVGSDYGLFLNDKNGNSVKNMEITSNYTIVRNAKHPVLGKYIVFVPLIELPSFEFSTHNVSSIILFLRKCTDGNAMLSSSKELSVFWYFDETFPASFRYEINVAAVNVKLNASESVTDAIIHTDYSASRQMVTFRNLNLDANHSHRVEVNVCKQNRCFGTAYSEVLRVVNDIIPNCKLTHATVNVDDVARCRDVSASWDDFDDPNGITFFTWSLSSDDKASILLTEWVGLPAIQNDTYNVHECLQLPVYASSTIYFCVRGYTKAGTVGQICQRIHVRDHNTAINTVYDFDATSAEWGSIKQLLHSHDVGSKMTVIHDNELNFGTQNSAVAGAMMYATERNVIWFLMTSPHLPVSCQTDRNCKKDISTESGYIEFPHYLTSPNTYYYICVHGNETVIEREYHTEVLAEISTCSNGFILDDNDPTPGEIVVTNHDGYITSQTVDVAWLGFNDNVDASTLVYPRNISYYHFKIGSTSNADDIVKCRSTSDRVWSSKNLEIKDGSTIYISVTAFDHSGHSTTVTTQGYVVDTSPPNIGYAILVNNVADEIYSTTNVIGIRVSRFDDPESGIKHFEIAVGSSQYMDDVYQTAVFYTNDIEVRLQNDRIIIDGHKYYIGVTAVNRAGLKSTTKVVPIIFDRTPPTSGQVMDGHWQSKKDTDFQTDIGTVEGHWTGFVDQQSGISYYSVGLGTRPYMDDVRQLVNVGLVEDISWKGPFIVGEKYFITVECCNGAGLCRKLSSDGITLDNSPPISGVVNVGPDSRHQKYIPHNTSLRVQWAGFEDPHSGIEKFEACIGENPYSCDVLPYFSCLLQSSTIKTGINLPLGKALYVTVIAYNKVSMNVTRSSDYFIVDDSSPVLVTQPRFLHDYNADAGRTAQWEKSVLRIYWEFQDKESPIIRHEITLKTHHDGHTPIEHVEVGNINKVTLTLDPNNLLHNGDSYSVLVTSCNAAGHCTTARSPDLLIDSTPPFLGGFKPTMTWENYKNGSVKSKLTLTWYGFQDEESGIDHYFITASKTHSGHELTNGTIKVMANMSNVEESASIDLTEALNADDLVILSIWAQNNAGLNSTIGRITVTALLTSKINRNASSLNGILEIQKHSCDVHFCNKDCTCAVLGQPCVDNGNVKPCTSINSTQSVTNTVHQTVSVNGGLGHMPQDITASSACLSGHWITTELGNATRQVIRYEWSAGMEDQPVGEGVFDLNSETPWNDIGLHRNFIHCLLTNRSLVHDMKYIIYVRAWYAFDNYIDYTSDPIMVDNKAPSVRRGRFVKDSNSGCVKDYDFIDWTDTITACWDGVFSDGQGPIIFFTLSFGTAPKADDVFATTNVYLNTTFTLTKMNLTHGTQYYFTVSAYNNVGLHTTASSDGVIIDTDDPTPGIVFNTGYHSDESYQSSTDIFSTSWHGFGDHFSGIRSYFVALVNETDTKLSNVSFRNVSLRTSYTFTNLNLTHGLGYAAIVKAADAAGHISREVRSSPKRIDTTPPRGYVCDEYEVLEQFNETRLYGMTKNLSFLMNFTKDSIYIIQSTVRTEDSTFKVNFMLDRHRLRLPVTTSHDGLRQLEYAFVSQLDGQENAVLIFDSVSPINGTALLSRCNTLVLNDAKAVSARQLGPNTISVDVMIRDEESAIQRVRVGAGSTPSGFQLCPLAEVHGGNNGILTVDAPHASPIYITTIAENHAGLTSVFHTGPITMDHTPPEVTDVEVNVELSDVKVTTFGNRSTVKAEWKTRDEESDVKACYCAIGTSKYSSNIVDMWKSNDPESCQATDLDLHHGTIIHVVVRCVNNVEIMTETQSEPIVIVLESPKSDKAIVSFVELSMEHSTVQTVHRGPNHTYIQTSDSHLQIQWSGFSDEAKIDHYEYRVLHRDVPLVNWDSSGRKTMVIVTAGYPFVSGDIYMAEVMAFNSKFGSDVVRASLLVCKDPPKLTGEPVQITRSGKGLKLDWSRVFQALQSTGIASSYSVSVGSRPGYNDVIEEQGMSSKSLDVVIPTSTIISTSVKEVFIAIKCSITTGLTETYETNYKVQ